MPDTIHFYNFQSICDSFFLYLSHTNCLFYFVSLCICLTQNHFIAVCYQCAKKQKENKKKPTNRKNRAVCFFLRHEYLNTYVQRDTEKKEGERLPSTANKQRKKMTTTAKKKERRSCTRTRTHTSKMALETK